MKTNKPILNMLTLLREKQELDIKLANLNNEIRSIPYYQDILAVLNSPDLITDSADQLADLIKDRDEPMTYNEIKQVFVLSGFAFNDQHILACLPNTQIEILEQLSHYRE